MSQTFIFDPKNSHRDDVLENSIAFLRALPKSKAWKLVCSRFVKERTDPQNHALFGVAYPAISAETGHTKDELHESFCRKVFGTVDAVVFGEVIKKPFRTTTTDENGKRDVIPWDQFSNFYAEVQRVAIECGIFVPNPDPMRGQRSRFDREAA